MNTMQDMKRRRSLFVSIALSLLVIGGLVLGSAPAQAATVDSTLSIPVSTTFTAADGTKFTVAGNVVVNCSAVTDATDVPPFVILTFDASGLTVTSGTGAKTTRQAVASGGAAGDDAGDSTADGPSSAVVIAAIGSAALLHVH